jgi:ribosomal protein S27AE
MADGYLNKCKSCVKSRVRRHREENDSVRDYDRKRGNRHKPGYISKHRAKYPQKYKAQTALNNAVRDGRLVKQSRCEECDGGGMIHGHHDDYLAPLKVRWLCARCHSRWHAANGEGRNAR